MNRFSLSNGLGAGILILGLATTPLVLPASAQNAESNRRALDTTSNRPALDTTPFQETKNDNNNYGWLGLIGLIGLVKLFRKSSQPERQPEPHVSNPSGYRDPDSVHPSSYGDSDAVGGSYTDPDAGNRPERR